MLLKKHCKEKSALNSMLHLYNKGRLLCAHDISVNIQKNREQQLFLGKGMEPRSGERSALILHTFFVLFDIFYYHVHALLFSVKN